MCAINPKAERGVFLINLLFFAIFLAIMGFALTTLIVAESRSRQLYGEERRAFYAAHTGLEYGIKKFLVSDVTNLSNWSETVATGSGIDCEVQLVNLGNSEVRIQAAAGREGKKKQLETKIIYIDISKYAIYAGGEVEKVITKTWPNIFGPHNPDLIYDNAPIMPIFDLEELRNLAKPYRYYPGSLVINSLFYFSANKMVFVEKHLIFNKLQWFGRGHFTVMKNVNFNSPVFPILAVFGTVYQPNSSSTFLSKKSYLNRSFIGGIITAGKVVGSEKLKWPFLGRLTVFRERQTIIYFMQHSLNGGPLVITQTRWKNLN